MSNPLILLVEDSPVSVRLWERVLRRAGFRTMAAMTAQTAMELFATHGAQVSLLVLDQKLPDMLGTDLLWWIRQQRPFLPVLMTSGSGQGVPQDVNFLPKPFLPEALLIAVRQALSVTA